MSALAVPVVEMAFGDGYSTAAADRTWTDVSDYVRLVDGIGIQYGRRDERSIADPNQLTLALNNADGRFTPGKSSGAYYPDVKIGVPVRVTCSYPVAGTTPITTLPTRGNLLSENDSSFETSVAGWSFQSAFGAYDTAGTSKAQSTAQELFGSNSLLATWSTTANGNWIGLQVTGLTIGAQYTWTCHVYVPTGSPDVRVDALFYASSAYTSLKNQWVKLSVTFDAPAANIFFGVNHDGATAGQTCYIDGAVLTQDTRFLGFVDDWSTSWPTSTDNHAVTTITATSRLARLGTSATLQSLLRETILSDSPELYWPLGEAAGATFASSLGATQQRLILGSIGSGLVTFGNANGAATDEGTAALFVHDGGRLRADGAVALTSAMTWEMVYHSQLTGSAQQELLFLEAPGSGYILLEYDNATPGIALVAVDDGGDIISGGATIDLDDGAPHHIALVANGTTMYVYVDGVEIDNSSNGAYAAMTSGTLKIGRVTNSVSGDKGSLSHVAFYETNLSAGTIADHADAALTGFAGELAPARIQRYALFAGVASTEFQTDLGRLPDLAHIDTTDQTALDLMRVVETSEGGVLFDHADGTLTFHDRAHRYGILTPTTLPAGAGGIVQADFAPLLDRSALTNDVTVTTTDGTSSERIVDTASIDAYGLAATTVDVATTDGNQPHEIASWLLTNYAEPEARAPALTVDMAPATDAQRVGIMGLGVGSKITVTGLPTQAEATSASFIVEGYSEVYGPGSHRLTLNVTPSAMWDNVMVYDYGHQFNSGKVYGL